MSIIQTIGGEILRPPYGALRRELIPGIFSGSGDLDRNTGALPPFNNVNAFGLEWTFFTVPAALGYQVGQPLVYYERMIQLTTIHTDALGHDVVSEIFDAHAEGLYWRWNEAGPTRIHYEIFPFVEVVFQWLIVKFP